LIKRPYRPWRDLNEDDPFAPRPAASWSALIVEMRREMGTRQRERRREALTHGSLRFRTERPSRFRDAA